MKIGFGLFCFGEDYYYKGTIEKINNMVNEGFHCYILTDNPSFFEQKYIPFYVHIIPYDRKNKSYHDKMLLPKYVLENNDICILIDTDTYIKDYSFLKELKNYKFKNGISYINTLINHPTKKEYLSEFDLEQKEWYSYKEYLKTQYPNYENLILIWEYFLVINKNGFVPEVFYRYYEKLQLVKEYCEITSQKPVIGAGEGISIQVSCALSGTDIQKDDVLSDLLKDKILSVSKRHTPPDMWPKWMK
jgi:hypothetical protein